MTRRPMTRRLVVSALPGEVRAALLVDGCLEDLAIERADRPSLLGNLYHGRVTKVDKALAAAFVEIGEDRPGFLPLSEAPRRGLSEGDALPVRVLREAGGGKGVRLSGRIKDPPDWLEAKLTMGARRPCDDGLVVHGGRTGDESEDHPVSSERDRS